MRDLDTLPGLNLVQRGIDRITGRAATIQRVANQPVLENELVVIVDHFHRNQLEILNGTHPRARNTVLESLTHQAIKIRQNNPDYVLRDPDLDMRVANIVSALIPTYEDGVLDSDKFMIVAAVAPNVTRAYRENAEKFADFSAEKLALVDNLTPVHIAAQPAISKDGNYFFGPRLGYDPERSWRYPMVKNVGGYVTYNIEDFTDTDSDRVLKNFNHYLCMDRCVEPEESAALEMLRDQMAMFVKVADAHFYGHAARPTFF